MSDQPLTRRGFLAAAAASAALACEEGPPPEAVSRYAVRAVVPLREVLGGTPAYFSYPAAHHAAMVVKLGRPVAGGVGPDGDIVAYHLACPHMGCPLTEVDVAAGTLGPCNCHLSLFDLHSGRQLHGRATQDLVRVQLELDGDTLCAVGLVGLPYGDPLDAGRAG